jgi:transcription elongation factor SPT6
MVVVQSRDAERIRDFILEHAPHVVLVGAAGLECRQLKEDLDSIRDHILMEMPRFMTTSDTGKPPAMVALRKMLAS